MTDLFTRELLLKIIFAFFSSLGFAIVLRVAPRHIVVGSVGGALTYLIYYCIMFAGLGYFAAGFISTAFMALYSEILARVKRAPAIVFLLPGVIPTVPGGDLYRGMRDLISGSVDTALVNFATALNIALGIAGGIIAVSITYGIVNDKIKEFKKKRSESKQ